jgi:hypothetical protein
VARLDFYLLNKRMNRMPVQPRARWLFDSGEPRSDQTEALIDGYAALARWNFERARALENIDASVQAFKVAWHVPTAPKTDSGQTIYLHMGMETSQCGEVQSILQPVLKWGPVPDGRKSWSIASYYVSGKPGDLRFAAMTEAVPVSPGDKLEAAIRLVGKGRGTFMYVSEFAGALGTRLYIASPNELVQIGVALEVSHVAQLSDLPDSDLTCFSGIEVALDKNATPDIAWEITNSALKYNVRAASIVHSGVQDEVQIFYR